MNRSPTFQELNLNQLFPFDLDDFQKEAIAALLADRSVVVCAPTGSGKTLIGEYAIHQALSQNRRVFYTTPLKALSNQKWRDFSEQFGSAQVGLLTGDVSINRDAPVLVMTTEIFRNMLYGTPIGEVGTSLTGVETVVLDECHYMNDRQRGTVWEESIIYCPPEIQLVALSATVANSQQLTDWIDRVHGPTQLIYSNFRPVPLEYYFCNPKGIFPLLNDNKTKINPRLKPKGGQGKGAGGKRPESPNLSFVLDQLRQRDMLPAIYFIFSRKGCDQAVDEVRNLTLVNAKEAVQLKKQIDRFLTRHPEAGRIGQIQPLYQGIAAHHAGILPAWKGLVEELFQQGLIKIVFATETLAAGINMPARTTVISTLSKRTDRGHRLLKASEFLQMAGRAGRRGMDERGYVVTLQTPFEGAKDAAYLATSDPDPLVSQFTPSYGMVLNLLQTHTIEEAKALVERSFGQYMATLYLKPQQQALADLAAEVAQIQLALEGVNPALLANYEKLYERLKVERQLLKTLQRQSSMQSTDLANDLKFAIAGTILTLKGKNVPVAEPLPATLVAKAPGSGQSPYLICLGQNNYWYVVTTADVVGLHAELPRLVAVDDLEQLPAGMQILPGQFLLGTEATLDLARQIPHPPIPEEAPEVIQQQQRVNAVVAQLETHPARQWGNPGILIKRYRRMTNLQAEIDRGTEQLETESRRHWEEFLALIAILQGFNCLDELTPTPLGQAAAAIRGDNELWLGLALMSESFDALDPHHLAAACAALVTETPRPDSATRYFPAPEVEAALQGLRGMRRQLFQMQRRYEVALPIWLEDELVGLVEQWALGVQWQQLCENTNLDEGDVVRMLRRTLDFLSQVPHVPHISESLRRNASRAIHLMDRFPVNEMVG